MYTELSIADGRVSEWHSVVRQHLHQSLWTRLHLWPSAMGAVTPAALAPGPGRAMPTWSGRAPEHMANKSTLKWCLKYINSCDRRCYTHTHIYTYTESWGVKPFREGTHYWYLLFEHMCAIMIKVENVCHNGLWVLVTVTHSCSTIGHIMPEMHYTNHWKWWRSINRIQNKGNMSWDCCNWNIFCSILFF